MATDDVAGEQHGPAGRTVTRLTDARALRAYAHPVRMKLVGLLRTEGPLTATRAGELLGESSGTCSFHLRQLAKYGLVEEAGAGMLNTMVAETYFEQLMRFLESRPEEPREWQDAAMLGDRILYLTAGELAELGRKVREMLDVYFERLVKPELRPPGARPVSYLTIAFPNDAGRRTGGG
jgi:hypothetical protein